ncbi:MAG: nickel pincer cofactor biosynthesis protein LarB [Acidobacteriota bacterium]
MNREALRRLLTDFQEGRISLDEAESRLERFPLEDLGFACIDHHRAIRQGFPEVIFGQGKTPEQILAIAEGLLARHPNLLVTRAAPEAYELLAQTFPEAVYHPASRAITVTRDRRRNGIGPIGVVCAGTTDIPVAEEAVVTAEIMGNEVRTWFDVGVAGLHRLLVRLDELRACTVVVAVAGMEGALPSVVGGLVGVPVIAVPTSVGYGASFRGLAALLGMLNSCASNVTVVNIDNGFGAGFVASLINRRRNDQGGGD